MDDFFRAGNSEALVKSYGGTKHTEVAEEFILPDLFPDIKKIIRADARPRIDGKYISQGKIEYDGEVTSRLLFIDEKNQLHAVNFTSTFSDSVEIPTVTDECITNLVPTPESLSCRTVNPRRVSVRLRIDTEITVRCMRSFVPELSGDHGKTEVLSEERSVIKLVCGGENGLTCAADLEADGALPQIGEVIACDVDMSFYECKGSDGRVLCRGDMPITVFYSSPTDDGEIYTVLFRKLPLAQVVAADGVDESFECTARGSVENVTVNVSENGFGERRIIELDVTYRIALNCIGNSSVTVTKDIYSCDRMAKVESETVTLNRFIRNYSTNFSVNHIAEAAELGINEEESVLAIFARPHTETVTLESSNKRLIVDGICYTGAILQNPSGLNCADYTVPFHIELEASGITDEFNFTCDAVCMSARGRLDGGKLYTDIELQLNISILSTEQLEIVRKVDFDAIPQEKEFGARIRLFYPTKNESLWSIGKEFGISCDTLKEYNQISENDKIPEVIIIPEK